MANDELIPNPLRQLSESWREEAATLEKRGAEAIARTLRSVASELDQTWKSHQSEGIPLRDASTETGFSRDHLARLVRQGTIANLGTKSSPRVRRCELPRKIRAAPARYEQGLDSLMQIARSVADSGNGGSDG